MLAFLGGGVDDVGQLAERRGNDLADEAAAAHVLARRLALPPALAHGVQDHLRVVRHRAHQLQRVEVRPRPAQPSQTDQRSPVICTGVFPPPLCSFMALSSCS